MAAPDEDTVAPPSGITLPPKDFRPFIEKVAGYVARNGIAFEDRCRANNAGNSKFSFLTPTDAYYPFYQWRLNEIREGRGGAVAAGRAGEETAQPKPTGPPEPPAFQFSARMPTINAQDLEVVKLTALFVAKNGRNFMTTLSQREAGNYQFDFLRPQHSFYQFFSRLVDQYTDLLMAGSVDGGKIEKARLAQLEHTVKERSQVLESAKQRAEWVRFQESQKQKKEDEYAKEKLAYAEIDWHEFTVVQTVEFDESDEAANLPPPISLSDLQCQSLEQKAATSHNMRIEEAMPTGEDEDMFARPAQSIPVRVEKGPAAYTPQPMPSVTPEPPRQMSAQEEEEEQRIQERRVQKERAQQAQAAAKAVPGQMRIRENYTPRAQARRNNVNMAMCPNCREQIPYEELEQHMKVELLDPRWKEQKAKADARYATTNLSTSDVANNLKRLASQRSDVFDGVTGQPISEEEQARRKKAATSYDGEPASKEAAARMGQMQSMNINEQIRQIHQKYK